MTVNLEVGMTAIRRDGERVGPVGVHKHSSFPLRIGEESYLTSGSWGGRSDHRRDIIAAGYPWADLGAQMGDTVRLVWNGHYTKPDDIVAVLVPGDFDGDADHPDSLYVIVERAATIPNTVAVNITMVDRPRAAHKLTLRDGDVVRLEKWQDGRKWDIGKTYTARNCYLDGTSKMAHYHVASPLPKGHRPLFTVISRAADAKADEVIIFHSSMPSLHWRRPRFANDTHRFTITFPAGSDTGTVTREKL